MSENNKKDEEEEQQMLQQPQKEPEPVLSYQYGETPLSLKCPYCLQHIRSQIINRPEFISVALGLSVFALVPKMGMMFLIIILIHLTAVRKHRCPLCERQLGSDGKFLIYFTDEVYSLTLFSSGLIFTKKMLVTGLLILFTFTVVAMKATHAEQQKWVDVTWPQYIRECLDNPPNPNICLSKYRGKQFRNWEAFVLKVEDKRQSNRKYYQHAVSIYSKMDPSLKEDGKPDVLLTLNSEAVFQNTNILGVLKHGDRIQFNCTLHDRPNGNIMDAVHFHIDTLKVTGHNPNLAIYTTQSEEQWIQLHVQDIGKSALTSEPEPETKAEPKQIQQANTLTGQAPA